MRAFAGLCGRWGAELDLARGIMRAGKEAGDDGETNHGGLPEVLDQDRRRRRRRSRVQGIQGLVLGIVVSAGAIAGLVVLSEHAPPACYRSSHCGPPSIPAPQVSPVGAAAWKGWPGAPLAGVLAPIVRTTLTGNYIGLGASPDGSRLLTVDGDGNVAEVNMRTGAVTQLPADPQIQNTPSGTTVYGAAVSQDLTTLVVSGANEVSVQQVASGKNLYDIRTSLPVLVQEPDSLALSPDGKWLAYLDGTGNPATFTGNKAHLVNVATRSSRLLQAPSLNGAESLAFSPDGKTLAVADIDGEIGLWSVPGGTLLATLTDPPDGSSAPPVGALAFGEHGTLLAAADDRGNVYLWDLMTGGVVGALPGTPTSAVTLSDSAAFSPDGRFLAVSFNDGDIGIWSVATGTRLAVLHGQNDLFLDDPIAFGLGGSRSLLANFDISSDITEWDLR